MNPHHLTASLVLAAVPRGRWILAVAAAALLAACGGGGGEDAESTSSLESEVPASPPDTVEGRQFQLWDPTTASTLQSEQLILEPDSGGNEVRLIVRMNPAAVQESGRASAVSSSGGESGDAAARHAQALAAKVSAVARAADAVMAQSVRKLAPGATLRQQYSHAIEGFVVTLPWSQAQSVADELARNPAVDAVEVDRVVTLNQSAPMVRTLDAQAWGVDRIDQRTRSFDNAFRSTLSGSGVHVYVVDTGIAPHAQFGARLRAGYSAVNDGRGSVDCHSHGTHVAGTAVGATFGVAPDAQVVPVRVLDCTGSGSSSQVIAGLDWIAAHGTRPGVVNMSLGGTAFSTMDTAAQRLIAAGFTVVAAAGNSNVDACTQSPARASGVITVGASDNADAKASFSNWGSCVALWAPGTQIGSAGIASNTAVATMNGTSMASPHVAGAAALVLQSQPSATAAQVLQKLQQQATPNVVTGTPGTMTRSLLYAGTEANTTPSTPTIVTVRASIAATTTQVPTVGAWTAGATVRVVNPSGEAVSGARVTGRFSNMATAVTCATAADGTCTVTSAPAPWSNVGSIGFAVAGVTGTQLSYVSANTVTAQIGRPAAPVATISTITGTLHRSTAQAVDWTPKFSVTVADERRLPVAGATVQAVLNIHAGARVVGVQTVRCNTAANGQCLLSWSGFKLGAAQTGATLQVLSVSRTFLTYQPGTLTRAVVGRVQ